MAEMEWGQRDRSGEWQPRPLPEPSPIFSWPLRLRTIAGYLFAPNGFLWPTNLFFALLAVAIWHLFTPSLDTMSTLAVGWIAQIYLRNVVILGVVAGGLHLRLYVKKAQGKRYKYNDKWLATRDKRFLFGSQVWDNVFWNLGSGAFFWTAWEAVSLWMYANGWLPTVSFREHPLYFVVLMFAVLLLRQFHFYWVHRLIHWRPLFNLCHYLHHKNINIGPWSGLTMHPIEHLIFFSGVAFHWIIPSHPIHIIYHLLGDGATPAVGHSGSHELVGKAEHGIKSDHYFHYLHHKYSTVNFGDESVPFDKWFGSHHDGSPEAQAAMMERRRARARAALRRKTET